MQHLSQYGWQQCQGATLLNYRRFQHCSEWPLCAICSHSHRCYDISLPMAEISAQPPLYWRSARTAYVWFTLKSRYNKQFSAGRLSANCGHFQGVTVGALGWDDQRTWRGRSRCRNRVAGRSLAASAGWVELARRHLGPEGQPDDRAHDVPPRKERDIVLVPLGHTEIVGGRHAADCALAQCTWPRAIRSAFCRQRH